MFSKVKNGFSKVGFFAGRMVKRTSVKVATLCAVGLATFGTAFAEGAAGSQYAVVTKDATSGAVSFSPSNVATPIIDGIISTTGSWMVILVILVVVGFIIYFFKKK